MDWIRLDSDPNRKLALAGRGLLVGYWSGPSRVNALRLEIRMRFESLQVQYRKKDDILEYDPPAAVTCLLSLQALPGAV